MSQSDPDSQIFHKLHISKWRQFADVDITFSDTVTILTGVNASGKTSLLNVLARSMSSWTNFISRPIKGPDGKIDYEPGFDNFDASVPYHERGNTSIGELTYSSGVKASIVAPSQVLQEFSLQINPYHKVAGIYVRSRRPIHTYQAISQIPVRPLDLTHYPMMYQAAADDRYRREDQKRVGKYVPPHPHSSIKETILNASLFSKPNSEMGLTGNVALSEFLEGFQIVLRKVLPEELGFIKLSIVLPEIVLETSTGTVMFDTVSGGVLAIIELVWQIYLTSLTADRFVVLIDEPENHLHPTLQQSLLPQLVSAFPQVQFIIASHNPLIVTSIQGAKVYALYFGATNELGQARVISTDVSQYHLSKTADETLREILGLEYSLPIWAAKRLRQITAKYQDCNLDEIKIFQLKAELAELGLTEALPTEVAAILLRKLQSD